MSNIPHTLQPINNTENEDGADAQTNGSNSMNSSDNEQDNDSSDSPRARRGDRRKISIEFIKDETRRNITFSIRKAGLMKKAYELSTLTGTEVLLLIVSETGLIYTFTTPKIQPLVSEPEGKILIKNILNAPGNKKEENNETTTESNNYDPNDIDSILKHGNQEPRTETNDNNIPNSSTVTSTESPSTSINHQSNNSYQNQPSESDIISNFASEFASKFSLELASRLASQFNSELASRLASELNSELTSKLVSDLTLNLVSKLTSLNYDCSKSVPNTSHMGTQQ